VTSRKRNALSTTAHHEAGHAVAAYYLGQSIRHASIQPKEGSRGHVLHYPLKFASQHGEFDDSLRGIHRAECRIIICLAGPLAQRKFAPRSQWRAGGGGMFETGSDFDTVADFLIRIGGADQKARELYSALLWRRAELLVDLRWKEIQAVAADLLEHRRLTARGVKSAIDRALGLKPVVLIEGR
jgi:hypothetical protein